MKGYIYTMFQGADPGIGWHMTDPIFGRVPTLGACMPNIRRFVVPGDYVFVVSGRVPGVRQYIVGGLRVAEKIDALAAYRRFPDNRLRQLPDGALSGNVLVDRSGRHHPLDYHADFENRVENYIVGRDPIVLGTPAEIERGRARTVDILSEVFSQKGKHARDIISRWRRLDEEQIRELIDSLFILKRMRPT